MFSFFSIYIYLICNKIILDFVSKVTRLVLWAYAIFFFYLVLNYWSRPRVCNCTDFYAYQKMISVLLKTSIESIAPHIKTLGVSPFAFIGFEVRGALEKDQSSLASSKS